MVLSREPVVGRRRVSSVSKAKDKASSRVAEWRRGAHECEGEGAELLEVVEAASEDKKDQFLVLEYNNSAADRNARGDSSE